MSTNNNTLLFSIGFKLPRQSRLLPEASSEAEEKAEAESGVVVASLSYWNSKKKKGLAELKAVQGVIKKSLYRYARYPFDAGTRILPSALAEPFNIALDHCRTEFAVVKADWLRERYPELHESAPTRMGSLHVPQDFPSLEECTSSITMDVSVIPLAEREAWQRIAHMSPNLAKSMDERMEATRVEAERQAAVKIWSDILGPIEHMVEVLGKDGAKIYDTLIGKVIDIVELVPAWNNIIKDQHLADVAEAAKRELTTINPDDLRESVKAREEALGKAKNILATFSPYARKIVTDNN